MNWWEWTLLGVGIWGLLIWAICVTNYRFWQFVQPHVCSGCQRHYVIVGCPIHDPQRRVAS
jgi:hypothetical protein